MKISRHFTLQEFTLSQTAVRFGIDNTPSDAVIENLKNLCENVLEPIRELTKGSIVISSGYRCQQLNGLVGGSKNSQHITGHAADIYTKKMNTELLFQTIIESKIKYSQVINEFDRWVHISFDKNNLKMEKLRAIKSNGKTVYIKEKF